MRSDLLRSTLILILFFPIITRAQVYSSDHLDGVVYAKVWDTSNVVLDPYQGGIVGLDTLITKHNVDTIIQSLQTLPKVHRVEFSDSSEVDSLVSGLEQLSFIEYAEKMPLFTTSHTPDDLQGSQWYLTKINAEDAWDSTKGDSGVTVAIVDNAVSTLHEDLEQNLWVNEDETDGNGLDDDLNGYPDDKHGYDVAMSDGDPNPPSGTGGTAWVHGTHVAGSASSVTNNGTGIASIGYDLSLIAIKCSEDGSGGQVLTHAYEGVDYAVSVGADVINMSFGSSSQGLVGQTLIQEADNAGIVLNGAAGNADTSQKSYPAAYGQVTAIGATDQNDEKASFSNYGSWLDVMAPGTSIFSTVSSNSHDNYDYSAGTSMATPIVSGLSGLILSVSPNSSPTDVEQFLKNGAIDISQENPNYTGQLGAGRIDAFNSIALASGFEAIEQEKEFSLYPNPSFGKLQLSSIPREAERIAIFDMKGKKVREQALDDLSYRRLDTDLSQGMYFLRITGKDVEIERKFIITPEE